MSIVIRKQDLINAIGISGAIGPRFVVYKDGDRVYVKNGITGSVEYSSSNPVDALWWAIQRAQNGYVYVSLDRQYMYYVPKFVSGGYSIDQMTFRLMKTLRPTLRYDDPRFSITLFETEFRTVDDITHTYSKLVVLSPEPTASVGNNLFTLTGAGNTGEVFYYPHMKLKAPYFVAVATVDSFSGGNPEVVIAKDVNNRLQWIYNASAGRFETYRVVNGTSYGNEITLNVSITAPFKLIMAVSGRRAMFFYEKDGKVRYVGAIDNIGFNFNDYTVFSTFKVGFGGYISANGSVSFSKFKVVVTPIDGFRDLTLITDKYGGPLIVGNKVYMTATVACVGIPAAYMVILAMDINTYDFELVSAVFSKIGNGIYGDHASHIIYDPDAGEFIVLNSSHISRSLFGVTKTLLSRTKENLLIRGVHVVDAEAMSLGDTASDAYDPYAIFDPSVMKWRIVFTNPFGTIKVAENPDMTTTGWTVIATASFNGGEGSKVFKVNGRWLISNRDRSRTSLTNVTDYPNLANPRGINVDVAVPNTGYSTHAMVIPVPKSGANETSYVLVMFDGSKGITGADASWGNIWIYEADNKNVGYEHPILIDPILYG